jgi:hypothetical protein
MLKASQEGNRVVGTDLAKADEERSLGWCPRAVYESRQAELS